MGGAEAQPVRRKRGISLNIAKHSPAAAEEVVEAEKGEPLSPAARLFRHPDLNCHVIAILGFGRIVTVQELKSGLEDTLLRHPRFSSVQIKDQSGRLRWVQTRVNSDDHILSPDPGQAAVAAASDPTVGDLYVENYTSWLSISPLNISRPLWDVHLIPIQTSETPCIAIFRIHHSLGDGISLMSLLLSCSRRSSDPKSLPSLPKPHRRHSTAVRSRPLMFLYRIWAVLLYVWNTLAGVSLFFSTALFLKDTETPLTGKKGIDNRPKRFVHRTLSLDEIKAVKNAIGCTINDVLVGVTAAALFSYLRSRSNGGILPKRLRIRTTLLVNIRPSPGIHALADMMKKGSLVEWGNRLGYVLFSFPVMKYEDPLDYVRKSAGVLQRKKHSLEAIFTYASGLFIIKALGIKAAVALCRRAFSNTTLSFSNIVGPTEEICFCGSPLVYIAPSVYGHPQALTIHFQSYMNKMKVVLAVDEEAIGDPHKLLDHISDSLQLIHNAV